MVADYHFISEIGSFNGKLLVMKEDKKCLMCDFNLKMARDEKK